MQDFRNKRQRGRGRKPGGGGGGGGGHHNNHSPNRTLESNGPDMKVRGPASHIYERYLQLARDASSSGDRVMSENYMQHAEHYFRVLRAMQPAMPPPQPQNYGNDQEFEAEDEGGPESDPVVAERSSEGGDQPDVEFPAGQQQQNAEGGSDGEFRRGRRGRRGRYRPEGERGDRGEGGDEGQREAREDRGERQERSERPERGERRERAPRERDGDQNSGDEGFSNSPRPAFLRND